VDCILSIACEASTIFADDIRSDEAFQTQMLQETLSSEPYMSALLDVMGILIQWMANKHRLVTAAVEALTLSLCDMQSNEIQNGILAACLQNLMRAQKGTEWKISIYADRYSAAKGSESRLQLAHLLNFCIALDYGTEQDSSSVGPHLHLAFETAVEELSSQQDSEQICARALFSWAVEEDVKEKEASGQELTANAVEALLNRTTDFSDIRADCICEALLVAPEPVLQVLIDALLKDVSSADHVMDRVINSMFEQKSTVWRDVELQLTRRCLDGFSSLPESLLKKVLSRAEPTVSLAPLISCLAHDSGPRSKLADEILSDIVSSAPSESLLLVFASLRSGIHLKAQTFQSYEEKKGTQPSSPGEIGASTLPKQGNDIKAASTVHQCAQCSRDASQICTRCRDVHYCGRECQKQHHKQHKAACSKSAAIKSAESKKLAANKEKNKEKSKEENGPVSEAGNAIEGKILGRFVSWLQSSDGKTWAPLLRTAAKMVLEHPDETLPIQFMRNIPPKEIFTHRESILGIVAEALRSQAELTLELLDDPSPQSTFQLRRFVLYVFSLFVKPLLRTRSSFSLICPHVN